jgi:hypothetical protein
MGIPMWKRGAVSVDCPYGNRDSPFPFGDVSIPVFIWELPYGNGEPNLLFPTRKLCSPFLYGDPQIHIVIPFMEINYASNGTSELLSTMLIPNTMNANSHNP